MVHLPSPPDPFLPAGTVVRRVDEFMRWADFSVDGVPPSWDLELTVDIRGEQIDHEAQRVLAFLLTWHSSRHGRPRFSGPAVNLSYRLLMTRFRMTEKRVVSLLERMENTHAVVHRYSRGLGKGKGAVLYLAPNMDRVEAITYHVLMDPRTGELRRWHTGDPVTGGPYSITSIRQHEADSTGIACLEDEEAVHLLSVQKRIARDRAIPLLPADATADGVCPPSPAYAAESPAAFPVAYAGLAHPASIEGRVSVRGEEGGHTWTGPVAQLCRHEQVEATGSGGPDISNAFGPVLWTTEPTGPHPLLPEETQGGHPEAARVLGAAPCGTDEAAMLPLGARGQVPTNARAGTVDDDLRLGHMLGLFRGLYARELERTKNVKARRDIVRAAWQAATRLLPGEVSSDDVYNAWQRLERAGSADPALDLLGVAVLACGRCLGPVDERTRIAHTLLHAVSRKGATDAVDLERPQEVAAVDRALRTALQHRLDRLSLARLVVHVCGLASNGKTYVFINGLLRLYETHEVPFNAPLFAGALASVVRDHRTPTALDLFDACEHEARLYPPCGRAGDRVRLGTWSLWTTGIVPDASVVSLGKLPTRSHDHDMWDTVDEVRVENYRFVAVTTGGSIVSLDRADFERHGHDEVYSLALRVSRESVLR